MSSPKIPLKIRLLLALHSLSVNALSSSDSNSVNRSLFKFFDPKASPVPSTKPDNGVVSSDVMVDPSRKLWFRLFTNTNTNNAATAADAALPVILYFHGGGFAYLAANSVHHDALCKRFARQIPALVVSVNYRLSPEHKCPAQYEDGFDVLKFIDSPRFEGFPANNTKMHIFVAGDSAGGNLAHHVALKACRHEFSRLKLCGVIELQPFYEGEERTESEIRLAGGPVLTTKRTDWMWKAFLPEGANRDHEAVNIFGPNSNSNVERISESAFPATLVFIGGFDPLQDWQRRYVEGLKKCGKEVYKIEFPKAIHGFYAFEEFPETALLMAEINSFIHKQLIL